MMNTQYSRVQYVLLQSTVIAFVFIAGCSTPPPSQQASTSQYNQASTPQCDIEGEWSWQQEGPGGPWSGNFVLEKKGDSYVGTLNDTSEGTYGDTISNVEVSNGHIKFTRQLGFTTQDFEGDLKEEDGRLKIIILIPTIFRNNFK